MANKIDISVDTSVNEEIISNLSSKQANLSEKLDDKIKDSDMCGRVINKVTQGFTELNNIKCEINNLNDALIDFLTDANNNMLQADESIAQWINN